MLDHFPRPPADNGRGVHWSHSQYFWGKDNWSFWKEQILAMNLKWVKILDDGDGSAEGLVKRLIDIKVMPVIRFYEEEPNPGHISGREADTARRYAEMGAVYFETNNEPDLDLEWKGRNRPPNWLDIVVDNFIIEADMIRAAGGYLLFPAFGPGGRGNPFKLIVEKGRKDILDGNCCLAIHNYCLGRPLDYPNGPINMYGEPLTAAQWEEQGGMWAWEMSQEAVNEHRRRLANPQASILKDSTCFRAFEYFDALVNEAAGHSIPIFTTEGGYNVGQRAGTTYGDDPRYPKPTPERAGKLTDDMFRYIEEEAPDYYFACMPWLIAVGRIGIWGDAFENQGPWFTHHFDKQFGLSGELPIVAKLKARPGKVRKNGPVPEGIKSFYTGPDLTGRKFDDRFKYLRPQVLLEPVKDPTKPHWRLVEARWADEREGGKGYIYVKALDENGRPVAGVTFQGQRPDAVDEVVTKGAIDQYLGNYLMTGTLGTYRVSMTQDGLPSDKLINVGLGNEVSPKQPVPTSFILTFQKMAGTTAPPPTTENVTEPRSGSPVLEPKPVPETRPPQRRRLRTLDVRFKNMQPPVLLEPVADRSKPYWRFSDAHWADTQETQGKPYVYVKALNERGQPIVGAAFQVIYGEGLDNIATKGAADQYLGSYEMTGLLGTYTIRMAQDNLASDNIVNVGLGDGVSPARTSIFLTFQQVSGISSPPAAGDEPGEQPGSESALEPAPLPVGPRADTPPLGSDMMVGLKDALMAAARQYVIPINRLSRLYQYARSKNLGEFLSAEFPLRHQGAEYQLQVFERGIVYMDKANPNVVKHIDWARD